MGDCKKFNSSIASRDANESGRDSPPHSFASFPISGTTITTCTSSRSSITSQRRTSFFPGVLRQVSRLRQPDSIGENVDHVVDNCQVSPRRHGQHHGGMTLLGRGKFEPTPRPPARSQSQCTNHCDSPVRSASKSWRSSSDRACTYSDGFLSTMSMTRDEFDALPLTIQRKVSQESINVIGNRASRWQNMRGQHAICIASLPMEWRRHSRLRHGLELLFGRSRHGLCLYGNLKHPPWQRSRSDTWRPAGAREIKSWASMKNKGDEKRSFWLKREYADCVVRI